MALFKCKMCGGSLEIADNRTTAVCEYCGTHQTLPKLDDERKVNLYDRANHFRRNNEYDKARIIYENILNEDNTDAEAYWSLVLCRYGTEYVEDPATKKRVPTVNRAQFTSVFEDENYKSALQYADISRKIIYEQEANTINEIQKGILQISQKEEPFDVFICYKETDKNGRRTQDSVLANDLYHQLTNEGFKVFFSRITLEDKLGTAYEPYIFAALNSAKVMVVLGTQPEYFNAVWVKNEWSRYLSLVKQSGGKKVLIPAYKDMDPYDLPEEFSHLQAQDMSKLGFMQDLIRGIKKLISEENPQQTVKETVVVSGGTNANIDALIKRVFMFLEDGDFNSADEYCEKVLDIDPENAQAYLGKLMVDLKCKNRNKLNGGDYILSKNSNYQKVIRFGNKSLVEELKQYNKTIIIRNFDNKLVSELEKMRPSGKNVIGDALRIIENEFKKYSYEIDDYGSEFYYFITDCSEKIVSQCKSLSDYENAKESILSVNGSNELIQLCTNKIVELEKEEKKIALQQEIERKIVSQQEFEKKAKVEKERKRTQLSKEIAALENDIKKKKKRNNGYMHLGVGIVSIIFDLALPGPDMFLILLSGFYIYVGINLMNKKKEIDRERVILEKELDDKNKQLKSLN